VHNASTNELKEVLSDEILRSRTLSQDGSAKIACVGFLFDINAKSVV